MQGSTGHVFGAEINNSFFAHPLGQMHRDCKQRAS
jgi:hypothetical protein